MADTPGKKEETWEAPIEPTKSVPVDIRSADPLNMQQEAVQIIEAESVRMQQSASFTILADDVEMTDSAAFIVRADTVRIEDSVTLILAAGEVKGNVTTVFTPLTAGIVGAAILIGMWIIRPRR